MTPESYIINTSRSEIINEGALLELLKKIKLLQA